jgi:hypothetical protein
MATPTPMVRLRGGGCCGSKHVPKEDNPFRKDDNPFRSAPGETSSAEPRRTFPVVEDNPFMNPAASKAQAAAPAPATAEIDGRAEPSFSSSRKASKADKSIKADSQKSSDGGGLTSSFSFFQGHPDKAHDKKVAHLKLDASVLASKASLRKLRDALDGAAKLYHKHGTDHKGKSSSHWSLTLPELAEWSQHESFCGDGAAAASLSRDATHLAAIAALAHKLRATIADRVVALFKEAVSSIGGGLTSLYEYELAVRDASNSLDHASKKLKSANAALEAAKAEEAKANAKLAKVWTHPTPQRPHPTRPHPMGPLPMGPHPTRPHPMGPLPMGPHPMGPHPWNPN